MSGRYRSSGRHQGYQDDNDLFFAGSASQAIMSNAGMDIESVDEHEIRKILKSTTDLARRTLSVVQDDPAMIATIREKQEKLMFALARSQIMAQYEKDLMTSMENEEKPNVAVTNAKTDDEAIGLVEDFKKRFKGRVQEYQDSLTEDVIRKKPEFRMYADSLKSIFGGGDSQQGTSQKSKKNADERSKTKNQKKAGNPNESLSFMDEDGHIPTVDPITKGPITKPIRNTICDHIYDHASITQIMMDNRKAKCPYMGCANPNPIRKEHLKEDPVMAAKIKAKLRRIQSRDEESDGGLVFSSSGQFAGGSAGRPVTAESSSDEDEVNEGDAETEIEEG